MVDDAGGLGIGVNGVVESSVSDQWECTSGCGCGCGGGSTLMPMFGSDIS